jgi:hypothetical protein
LKKIFLNTKIIKAYIAIASSTGVEILVIVLNKINNKINTKPIQRLESNCFNSILYPPNQVNNFTNTLNKVQHTKGRTQMSTLG